VLFDVKKAFDSVWQEGLQQRLVISNFYLYFTKIIASFLNGCSFHVCINEPNSVTYPNSYGVPQEAILFSFLYNFFTAESPQSNECKTSTFADDTMIFVSDGNPNIVGTALQGHFVTLSTNFEQWKIKINASKTKAIYFTATS
jgi:hypothetical protein